MRPHFLSWCSLTIVHLAISCRAAVAAPVSFAQEIAPILIQKCATCHGPEKSKGGFQLHTFELLLKSGDSKAVSVTPGQPKQSMLFELLTTNDADDRMPQKDDPLPATQIALIERWIKEGARFDGPDPKAPLLTYAPQPPHPAPPAAYPQPVPVLAMAFSPDGELAVGGYHEVTVWNPEEGTLLRRLTNVAQRVQGLAYSPDGARLVVAGGSPGMSGEVKLFDPAKGVILRTLAASGDMILAVCFSPDGRRLATGGADNAIRVFNADDGKPRLLIEQHTDWVMGLAFSPDGAQLVSASRDKSARVFDAQSGALEDSYTGHGDAVFSVAFSDDGKLVYSAGRDKEIHVWQAKDGKKVGEIGGSDGEVLRVIVAGETVFSAAANKLARQHQAREKRELIRSFAGHTDCVYALAWHEPTRRLATGGFDGEVRVWNAADGKLIRAFFAAPGYRGAATGR